MFKKGKLTPSSDVPNPVFKHRLDSFYRNCLFILVFDEAPPPPSMEIRYRQIFKRIIGAERLEKNRLAKVMQVGTPTLFHYLNG